MNALKSTESDLRCTLYGRELEIDLYCLISRDLACVGYRDIGGDGLPCRHSLRGDTEVAVLEGGVAESVAKLIERLAFEVPVGPVCHFIILEMGELGNVLVERNRQPTRGIVLAAQRLSDRCAAFFAGIPCFENRVGMIVDPVDGQRTSVQENDGERFTSGCYGFNQCFFRLRKIDADA